MIKSQSQSAIPEFPFIDTILQEYIGYESQKVTQRSITISMVEQLHRRTSLKQFTSRQNTTATSSY
jgi:hypothetical protein